MQGLRCIMHASRERSLHLERAMTNRALLLSAIPLFIATTSGCIDSPVCSGDDVIVYDDSGQGACMRRYRGYAGSTSSPKQDAGASSQEATSVATTTGADASTSGTTTTDAGTSPL